MEKNIADGADHQHGKSWENGNECYFLEPFGTFQNGKFSTHEWHESHDGSQQHEGGGVVVIFKGPKTNPWSKSEAYQGTEKGS